MILRESSSSLFITVVLLVVAILIGSSTALNETFCDGSCGRGKSAARVSYPFGFSGGCPIQLNCSGAGEVSIGGFGVLNLTETSVFVHLPAQCDRSVEAIQPLFGSSYGASVRNSFLLQNCIGPPTGCFIDSVLLEDRLGLRNCSHGSSNISCFSQEDESGSLVMSMDDVRQRRCGFLFTAIASGSNLEFNSLELVWWVNGVCPSGCDHNAQCVNVSFPGGRGYRCRCRDGFRGDGFRDGGGCRRVTDCNASNYMSGQCGGPARLGIVVGGILAVACLVIGVALLCHFLRKQSTAQKTRISTNRLISEAAGNLSVPFYPYKEIERATNGFSEKHMLGTGAYGTVYAGKLHSSEWLAIKKIRRRDNESVEQVMNEIKLISAVDHPNLVRLLGCCIENGEQILVYEFMANGTLSEHLQRELGEGLSWGIRLRIAAETARAIAHLHCEINPPIFHRDIKSSNILLDREWGSKVADFGLSRVGMFEPDDSHISTAPQGTPGYLDPQYHQNFHLSDKSDVYSFGVVLAEIVTGMKAVDFARGRGEVNLAALAVDRIGRGLVDEMIDPFLEPDRDAWTLSSIHKVAELAFRCLAFDRDARPGMAEVAEELERVRQGGWGEKGGLGSSVASSGSVTTTRGGDHLERVEEENFRFSGKNVKR